MGLSGTVVLLAHGAVTRPDDVETYYRHIREGKPLVPAVLEALKQHYAAIGGSSPLNGITRVVAHDLEVELAQRHGPGSFSVRFGFRHTPPFAAEVMAEVGARAQGKVVAIPMAPHGSPFVEQGYARAMEKGREAARGGAQLLFAGSWHLEPKLLECWSQALDAARKGLPAAVSGHPLVVFTAHSLPVRVLQGTDYERELCESAAEICRRSGIPEDGYRVAWQSASPSGEPWMGPDIREVLRQASDEGRSAVVVVPQGFVADHLEVLYDLDLVAQKEARTLGLAFARAAMPNTSPLFVGALADLTERTLRSGP